MFDLEELLNNLELEYKIINGPAKKAKFIKIAPIHEATENSLIFINEPNEYKLGMIKPSKANLVIMERDWGDVHIKELLKLRKTIFLVNNTRYVIARLIEAISPYDTDLIYGFDSTSTIHPEAEIHPKVKIGKYCVIGKCKIGANSYILDFTTIKDNVYIGSDVIIREYCMIGGTGFGFAENNKEQIRIRHIGGVIIGDNVEIFPYSNVDRGTLANTIIGRGTKIDHYCHIGHNCIIGENNLITAQVVTAGGSKIGNNCWIGVGSVLKEKIIIGDNVTLGAKSFVNVNLPSDAIYVGIPAKPKNGCNSKMPNLE